jgi:asparagine synthetase B (glutamine-hydrolysing)
MATSLIADRAGPGRGAVPDHAAILVLSADPERLLLRQPDGVWLASGFDRQAEQRLRRAPSQETAAQLCRELGDATVLHLAAEAGRTVRVLAWRGASSAFELFYALRPSGAVVISDHFGNLLARLPVADRAPCDEAVLDHFLFRTVPGCRTYSRAVRRLGHGERLAIDPATGAIEVTIFHRLGGAPEESADLADRLDAAFAESVGRFAGQPGLVSMFSGGIDSTLLQSYLGRAVPAVFYAPERVRPGTPDLARYARRSAALLDISLEVRPLREEETWTYVERNIDRGVWPQHSIQSVKYGHAFAEERLGFVLGERADALFGAAATRSALVARHAQGWPARTAFGIMAGAPMGRFSRRARAVLKTAAELSRAPASPEGWAAMSTQGFSDHRILADIAGTEAVRRALQERLDYIVSRLEPPAAARDDFSRHLELAHWIDCLCEDHTTFIRQLALAHGKSVHLPFLAGPVVRLALSVPPDRRYHRGMQVKYLLKDALRRRVPAYPVDQRKGITSMAMPRRYKGGELCALWEDYPLPGFVPPRHHAALAEFRNALSIPAMTFAMLQKRVLANPGLQVSAGAELIAG